VGHPGSLSQPCERELLDRERRAAGRRLKAAKFPAVRALEDFDFLAQPPVNKPPVLELLRCHYVERRENVLLVGSPGAGKTHLATALAVAACGVGKRVRFWRVTELVTRLMEAREERVLTRWECQLGRPTRPMSLRPGRAMRPSFNAFVRSE
jgi:DNA replication protein DnaC